MERNEFDPFRQSNSTWRITSNFSRRTTNCRRPGIRSTTTLRSTPILQRSSPISPVGSMNLLSLTFQRLQLVDSNPKSEELIEDEEAEASKERLRRLKQRKHEPRSGGKDDRKRLRTINLDEVAWHDTADSCWLVIDDYVYDCTDFLDSHPGGRDVLLEYAGRDATLAFIGTGHSRAAIKSLENYIIGELPPEERIFRVPGGLKIVGL